MYYFFAKIGHPIFVIIITTTIITILVSS